MKFLLSLFLLPCSLAASAQYYYKDIVGTRETNEQLKRYREAGVRSVAVSSFDADGSKSDALDIQQSFTGNTLVTTTVLDSNTTVLQTVLDEQGRVARTVDSSEAATSITTYTYNAAGQLERTESRTADPTGKFVQREEHRWEWSGNNVQRMLRIRNGVDTSIVRVVVDEKGQVSEEHAKRAGLPEDVVYYYYNEAGRLTDIVRFNEKAKRLLPEYMFEYDDAGRVIQRITVPANNSNYSIWRYQYDNRGLKTREALYNRAKQLTGKVEYQYTTGS
ncbi:RHS repeat domain-containing protein [Flaviaesturariibacter terrae]